MTSDGQMTSSRIKEIKVKSVYIENGLIKIVGIEKESVIKLQNLQEIFEHTVDHQQFQLNAVYVTNLDNNYERCKYLDKDDLSKSARVYLIDSNHEVQVPLSQLHSIAESSIFTSSTAFWNEYCLAEICVKSSNINIACFRVFVERLQNLLKRNEFLRINVKKIECGVHICKILSTDLDDQIKHLLTQESFIKFTITEKEQSKMISDYAEKKKVNQQQQQMRPIARNLKAPAPPRFKQDDNILSYDNSFYQPATYKSHALAINTEHQVRVTYLEKSFNLFYIQLISMDAKLQTLAMQLQTIPLRALKDRPKIIGMPCIAKFHKKVYRVTIGKSNEAKDDDMFLCHFVDFGFSNVIKFENLFYIPTELIAINAFAISFGLSGLKRAAYKTNFGEINYIFRQITENKLMKLKCVASDGPPICQYCELYDGNGRNILDILMNFSPSSLKFPQQAKLDFKTHISVKVVYVATTNEFYIQIQDAEALLKYDMLYHELQEQTSKAPIIQKLIVGMVCGIKIDQEWYRGQIVSLEGTDVVHVKVQVIDYGIIEEVSAKSIRLLSPKLTEMPPFAYQCCLKGFEKIEVSENIITQFEIFCSDGQGERRVFKMFVDDLKNNGYVVELEDESVSPPAHVNRILLKNSRPLAETITLENAKKRQKEANFKKEVAQLTQTVVSETQTKESPDRNRNSSQRGRGRISRSSPPIVINDKLQRTHFGKTQQSDTYFKSPREAEKQTAKLKPYSSSSFETNWREPQFTENTNKNRKSKSPKSVEKKQREVEQKSTMKREKSSVDEKTKKVEKMKSGWVSTLCSINKAYVHLDEHLEGLERIMNGMFNFYEKNSEISHPEEIKLGSIYALYSADENWYRGELKQTIGDLCQIQNLEYGNLEVTHKKNIWNLEERFAKENRFLSEVYFAIKALDSDEKLLNEMKELFKDGGTELKFDIIKKFRSGVILEIIDIKSENFFDNLVTKKLAVRISEEELGEILDHQKKKTDCNLSDVSSINEESSLKEEEIPKKETKITGKITALTSPTDFYLSSKQDLDTLNKLHKDIQCFAAAMSPLLDFDCGVLCLVKYPFDNMWYRAKIIDSDDTIITVLCIDNGKTFSIDDKISLKVLPEQLKRKSFCCMSCSLPISIERKSDEEATNFMLTFIDLTVEYEIILTTMDKTYVEVSINNENMSEFIVKKNLAKHLDIFQCGNGYTSHINSLDDFYIQLETDQLKLDLIGSICDREDGKFEKITDPKIGQIVAGKFNDDNCWYRSKIESIKEDGFMVKFIDYGNYSITKDIGLLDESITILPELSKKCCLSKPRNILNFSEAAEKKFVEICNNGATVLNLNVVKPGETTEIELFWNGQNIIELLTPLCTIHENTDDF